MRGKMKRKLLLLIIVLGLSGCSADEKKYFHEEQTGQILEDESEETEMDYGIYRGIWSEGGTDHANLVLEGGTEFHIEIENNNELSGYLFSQQGTSERVAEIEGITGNILNGECYYEFDDDGWGGSGTLSIKFMQDEVMIEVQNYKMADSNLSGYGISGSYKLIRMKESHLTTDTKDVQEIQSEKDIEQLVYDRYYSKWSEEEMLAEIERRQPFLENCFFYNDVIQYLEDFREVRDISTVVEPLYYTDLKYYTEEDFKGVPEVILRIAQNEIYARHGYIFKDKDLKNYFEGQLWYVPTCEAEEFTDMVFNEYEKANLDILSKLEN